MSRASNPLPDTIYAIQHLAFEDLGHWEDIFYQLGFRVRYFEAGVEDLTQALTYAGLTILLGGPIAVYDTPDYPFLQPEIDLLSERLSQNLPTLGICLGAQLIAHALGAKVYAGQQAEIGWSTLDIADTEHNPLSPLQDIPVLHWHGDTFDLPEQAELLASSALYPNQAFSVGHNILALQTDATPNAERRIILEGNHDARLQKKLLNDASQFHGIKAVGDEYPAMSLPNLLKLDKIGHEYIGGYPANEYQYREDLIFIHGSGGGANPTKKLQEKYPNENVVQGHLHRINSEMHTRRDGRYIGKYIMGLMGKIDGSLPSVNNGIDSTGKSVKKYEQWQQGAMIINDYGDGNYEFNQIPINEGKAYWQGKRFEGKES